MEGGCPVRAIVSEACKRPLAFAASPPGVRGVGLGLPVALDVFTEPAVPRALARDHCAHGRAELGVGVDGGKVGKEWGGPDVGAEVVA